MDKKTKLTSEEKVYICSWGVLAVIIVLWIVHLSGAISVEKDIFFCWIKELTGVPCPGCGSTRALYALAHGHIWESIVYNPIVLYGAVIFIIYFVTNTIAAVKNIYSAKAKGKTGDSSLLFPNIGMKIKSRHVTVGVVIMLASYILRLIIN